MGADAFHDAVRKISPRAKELISSKVFDVPTVDRNLLESEDSTMTLKEAVELVNQCSKLESHEDELEKFKQIGSKTPILASEIGTDPNYEMKIVWFNLIGFIVLHIIGLTGGLAAVLGFCKVRTSLYSLWLIYAAGQGVTMGAHRHWSHRAFKAKRWLKIVLLYMHTLAGQNCLWVWVRDHRQHHKYSDTDADPHNANRGFWFSHVGWLCVRKHPKVLEYGKKIDMSDLDADPYIMFQKDHYKVLYTIFALGLPTVVPIYFWNENPLMALWVAYFARTIINLNATWLVNSAAHLFGTRPYDKTIFPVESMFVAALTAGEGWHNYHHAFPWDYRAAELGTPLNLTCKFIDFFAKYGAIYDLREATATMVKNRCLRTGDKSHEKYGEPKAAPPTKTFLKTWHHPLNPSYTTMQVPKLKMLPQFGYALVEEELHKNELDDDMLSKENEILQSQRKLQKTSSGREVVTGDSTHNYLDANNNTIVKRNKSSLDADSTELPSSSCPGLATSSVSYKSE